MVILIFQFLFVIEIMQTENDFGKSTMLNSPSNIIKSKIYIFIHLRSLVL